MERGALLSDGARIGPRLMLLAAVAIWGCTFVATKICLRYLTPLELLGSRLAVALPVLFGMTLVKRVSLDLRGHGRAWLIGSLIIGVHFYVQTAGLQYTTATRSGWIIAVTPLVMAVLASVLLRERIDRGLVGGIAVSTLGVLLLVSDGRLRDLNWLRSTGDWLVLASAYTWALYTVAVRNLVRERPPLAVTTAVLFPATVACVLGTIATSDLTVFRHLPLEAIVSIGFLGIFGMAVAHSFWQYGVAALGAARAGAFLYLEPLSTTALAASYLGEPCGPFTIGGGVLVLFGVWLAERKG